MRPQGLRRDPLELRGPRHRNERKSRHPAFPVPSPCLSAVLAAMVMLYYHSHKQEKRRATGPPIHPAGPVEDTERRDRPCGPWMRYAGSYLLTFAWFQPRSTSTSAVIVAAGGRHSRATASRRRRSFTPLRCIVALRTERKRCHDRRHSLATSGRQKRGGQGAERHHGDIEELARVFSNPV